MVALLHSHYARLQSPGAARRAGLAISLALHFIAVCALLSYAPARSALFAAAPIMVDLLAPPVTEPKRGKPTELPQPRPVAKAPQQSAAPHPMLTAPSSAPALAVTPLQPPAPPAAAPADAVPVAAAASKPALPVTPPIFNADYLENPAPAYPPLSRRTGEQGRVTLRVLVNASGRADDAQVRASSGSARLDDSARSAVLQWKFVPAKRGDEPVPAWVLIPITFRLEG